jgi:hypothetical protein
MVLASQRSRSARHTSWRCQCDGYDARQLHCGEARDHGGGILGWKDGGGDVT